MNHDHPPRDSKRYSAVGAVGARRAGSHSKDAQRLPRLSRPRAAIANTTDVFTVSPTVAKSVAIASTSNRVISLLLILFAMLALPMQTLAHGGGYPLLENHPIDDRFVITIWTQDEVIQTGEVHFSVGLAEAVVLDEGQRIEAGAPVLDEDVRIFLSPRDNDALALSLTATHDDAAVKFLYETDFVIEAAGIWDVEVRVGESDTIGFPIEVEQARPVSIPQMLFFVAMGAAATVLSRSFWRRRALR